MRCHYCDRDAAITVESGGLTVGLCEDHFQERMEELAADDTFAALEDELDIDRPE